MKRETRASFAKFHCSIARAIEHIEPTWTPLILRDFFFGLRRFEELGKDLGLASNMLADRLDALVERGILERITYHERPARYEYRPTRKGAELFPVLLGFMTWGDAWTSEPDGPPVQLRHMLCGRAMHAQVVCRACGESVTLENVTAHAGPGARAREGTALLATHLPLDPASKAVKERAARRTRVRLRERFDPAARVPAERDASGAESRKVAYRKPARPARAASTRRKRDGLHRPDRRVQDGPPHGRRQPTG